MACVLVVLAAGRGARFRDGPGERGHKLEQAFGHSTVLGSTLANAVQSGLPLVVVTTAALLGHVTAAVAERDTIVLPEVGGGDVTEPLGMGYSIAAGVSARANAGAWLILPADMPLVQPDTLRAVAQALPQHPVVYAQYQGRRGHPVGFGTELYSELVQLSGDEGARRLIGRYPAHGVEVSDSGVLMDMDTEDDLQRLRALQAARAATIAAATG
jgi:molybdenum cofactor cytidylyltransferase